MADTVEHLRMVHTLCQREIEKLQKNFGEFIRNASDMLEFISSNWSGIRNNDPIGLIACENYLSSIMSVNELSRKFNMHLSLTDMSRKGSQFRTFFQLISVENISFDYQKKAITPPQPMEPAEPAEKEGVQFPNSDLSIFTVNTEFFATITCISDHKKLKFFILALQYFPEMAKLAKLHNKLEQMTHYTEVPPENEIFGIMVESLLFRAVLIVTPEQQHHKKADDSQSFPVLLLDYGDIIEVSKSSAIYHIPLKYKEKPARAIECVLESINGDKSRDDMGKVLQHYEFKKAKFTIVRNTGTMLSLNLVELTNRQEQLPTLLQTENSTNSIETNPFRLKYDDTESSFMVLTDVDMPNISIASIKEEPKMSTNTNNSTKEIECSSMEFTDVDMPNISIVSTKEEPKMSNNLTTSTKEEPKMSNNSISSNNQVEPKILNYEDTDCCIMELNDIDKLNISITSTNEPKMFNNSNTSTNQVEVEPESWIKDVRAETIDLPPKNVHFEVGFRITIVPTYIAGIENFYAQAESRGSVSNLYIWNPGDITENQKLHRPPIVFDLVLARYKDDHWYRAKVTEILNGAYKVFYVDFGNCETVTLNYLAMADKSVAQQPFQAVKCRLANIRDITKNNKERDIAVNLLSSMILNHRILVQVLSHKDELILGIIDKHFYDIPNTLITKGYAKAIKTNL